MNKKHTSANEMTLADWEGRHGEQVGEAGIYSKEMKSVSWREIYIPSSLQHCSQ